MTVFIFLWMFAASLFALEYLVPHDVRFNRVGGLLHWRFGRLGGSFYLARRR